jgi:hypothetical protein
VNIESMTFYECVDPRCKIKWWPVQQDDKCPGCDHTGPILGTMTKDLDAEREADESHDLPYT